MRSEKQTIKRIKVLIADDHILLRNGLAGLINNFDNAHVCIEASNGLDMINKVQSITKEEYPDIALIDINMPEMDGFESTKWLVSTIPNIKVCALTMYDDERSIIKMIKSGATGYLSKEIEPGELLHALEELYRKGIYYSDTMSYSLLSHVRTPESAKDVHATLTQRELDFLKASCSDLSYKEIAEKFKLSPRTIDGIRDILFVKLKVKTRFGLIMYALRNKIIEL